ncbi:MAG: histidine--tRNA ligase, partial [Anaerolineaceae bacterium]|nr:histidine--tRNA ligase [Anaerolineaceae bacterium]
MKPIIKTVKGTREFYPEDMMIRNWLYSQLQAVSNSFGYQEYDGPFLEKIDLYAAKSGEELVKKQSFVFEDRGGDEVTLRPELTPSLARMIAQRQRSLIFPLRWWSFGPFWRYERPQKGRTREFFQWNADLIGADTPEADAELVAICASFFKQVGLSPEQVEIVVNDRQLMDVELGKIGITPELKPVVFRLVDRRDKMPASDWETFALESGLTIDQLVGLKVMLSDRNLWKKSSKLTRFFAALEWMGVDVYVRFDPQIIRGLDYYTGIVFEARDRDKEGRAILGGGHYGNLVGDVGGDPLPGVGFAMGDVMITLVLQKYGCIPPLPKSPLQVLVTVFDDENSAKAFSLAKELRGDGIRAVSYLEFAKLSKQLKYADCIGVRFAI